MEEYTKIAAVDNQFEAQILEEVLKERGIPFLLKSYYDSAYDGLFQGQKGWGAVYAPGRHGGEIAAILAELRENLDNEK
jgi:hypothetical protein